MDWFLLGVYSTLTLFLFFFFITVWTCVLCVCSLKVKIFPAKIMIFGLLSMKESLMYCQEHYFLTVVHISNSCSN